MKHNTINLVKFKALSKRLELPLCWTVGALETLWLFALHNSRDGDLSKFSALEIAGWMEFPGDENDLVDALVETGWLDREGDRLAVHDWHEHKPNWLKGVESREPNLVPNLVTENSQPSPEPSPEPSSEPSTEPRARVARTKPNPTQPNQAIPSPTSSNQTRPDPPVGGGGGGGDWGQDWERAKELANANVRRIGRLGTLRDRRRFIQVAYIAANELDEEFLLDPLRIMETTPGVEKPFAFWLQVTRDLAAERGFDFDARLKTLKPPPELDKKPDWMR